MTAAPSIEQAVVWVHFKGQLRVPGEVGEGIPVDLHLDDIFVVLSSDEGELGRWRMDDVVIGRLESNQFTLRLAEEEMVFVANDALGFAYEGVVAVEEIAARLRKKRRGRRGQKGRRSKSTTKQVVEATDETVPEAVSGAFETKEPAERPVPELPLLPAPERRPTPPPLPTPIVSSDPPPESPAVPATGETLRPEPASPPAEGPASPEPQEATPAGAHHIDALDPSSSSFAAEAVTVVIPPAGAAGDSEPGSADLVYARVPPTSGAKLGSQVGTEPADGPHGDEPAEPMERSGAADAALDVERKAGEPEVSEPEVPEPEVPEPEVPEPVVEEPVARSSSGDEIAASSDPAASAEWFYEPVAEEPQEIDGTAGVEPSAPSVPAASHGWFGQPLLGEGAGGDIPEATESELPQDLAELPETELPQDEPAMAEAVDALPPIGGVQPDLPALAEDPIVDEAPIAEPDVGPIPSNGRRETDRRGSLFSRRRKEQPPHEHVYTESRTAGGITRRVCECGHVSFSGEDVYQHWR